MCLQLLAFELEGVGHQSCLGGPRVGAQTDLSRHLKTLQLGCNEASARVIVVFGDGHANSGLQLFDLLSPADAASEMTLRTSSSTAWLLHSSSQDPRIPYWPARARSCFGLGTTKPIMYVSSLLGGRGGGVSKGGKKTHTFIK